MDQLLMPGRVEVCALCGLPTPRNPTVRTVGGQEQRFCCSGCAVVYELAHQNGLLEQVLAPSRPPRAALSDMWPRGEKAFFALQGLECASCALVAERLLARQPGVLAAEVSFAAERGYLRYDPQQTSPGVALRRLERLGLRPQLAASPAEERCERRRDHIAAQFLAALGLGMNIMALYLNQLYHYYARGVFSDPFVRGLQYLVWLEASLLLLVSGTPLFLGACRALRARTASMDTLVTLGILAAYGYSAYVALTGAGQTYFDSVAMIVTFVTLGRLLEAAGGAQARKDIRKLLALQPAQARRRIRGEWQELPTSDLAVGDVILVRRGERVPVDAQVVEGEGTLDEALLTGEAALLGKRQGDAVYAGTLLVEGALTCLVVVAPEDTRLAQIARLVEQALATKPPVQRLADRAAACLALGVVSLASLTAAGWLFTGHAPAQSLLAAVAVLVVACPCALGLATPLALAIGLGRAAQEGILVRNPAALETAARAQRVVFDKTGTLTQGRMAVVAVTVAPEAALSPEALLSMAAAVEQYSEHPVARAILSAGPATPPSVEGFQAVLGLGASAQLPGEEAKRVWVGSERMLGGRPGPELQAWAQLHSERGETVVWVAWEQAVAGFIALRDEPSSTAREALRRLEGSGVCAVMLSGDHPRTALAVATELGLPEYEGGCSPQDKAARIVAWQKAGEWVAMVGDGVNDALALAQADLSVTVAGGTDVAGEASDVILTRPDLTLVPDLIRLSRRTRQTIRLNLAWAAAYNLVTAPLAVFGVISPAIAAAAMTASSLLVVGNSLRLRR